MDCDTWPEEITTTIVHALDLEAIDAGFKGQRLVVCTPDDEAFHEKASHSISSYLSNNMPSRTLDQETVPAFLRSHWPIILRTLYAHYITDSYATPWVESSRLEINDAEGAKQHRLTAVMPDKHELRIYLRKHRDDNPAQHAQENHLIADRWPWQRAPLIVNTDEDPGRRVMPPFWIVARMLLTDALMSGEPVSIYRPSKRMPQHIYDYLSDYIQRNTSENIRYLTYLDHLWPRILLEFRYICNPAICPPVWSVQTTWSRLNTGDVFDTLRTTVSVNAQGAVHYHLQQLTPTQAEAEMSRGRQTEHHASSKKARVFIRNGKVHPYTPGVPDIVQDIVAYWNCRSDSIRPDSLEAAGAICDQLNPHTFNIICSRLLKWWAEVSESIYEEPSHRRNSLALHEGRVWCQALPEVIAACPGLGVLVEAKGQWCKFASDVDHRTMRRIKRYVKKQKRPDSLRAKG